MCEPSSPLRGDHPRLQLPIIAAIIDQELEDEDQTLVEYEL